MGDDNGHIARRLDRRASWTAQFCAAERAAESMLAPHRRRLDDPYARHFVTHPLLRPALHNTFAATIFVAGIEHQSPGLHAFVVLRARHVEEVCRLALDDGIDQIILLGAGFDTTSLRLNTTPVTVFEVDAPSTLADKRSITEHLLPRDAAVRVVWTPCDLEHDPLQERLLAGGFDPKRQSVVVWMGVTMFLTTDAMGTTLTDLNALCAPGSLLVFDYADVDVITGASRTKGARRVARSVKRRGEPYRTGFTPTTIESFAARYGFACAEHLGTATLFDRYAMGHSSRPTDQGWLTVTTAVRR